jgi:hypothetical protein
MANDSSKKGQGLFVIGYRLIEPIQSKTKKRFQG